MSKGLDALVDLAIEVDAPSRMEIINPKTMQVMRNEAGEVAYLDLLSMDSQVWKDHERRVSARRSSGRRRQAPDQDETENDFHDLLARLTTGWHLVGKDGKTLPYEFSTANARALYADRRFAWLKRQANLHIGDIANFDWASSKTS